MYGDQSGEFVFVPTWDVVACLGGVERGRGGEGRREGGRLGIEGGSPFSISLFPPLPTPDLSFFSAPAAQVRVVGVHRSPGAHNPDCATSMRSCHGVLKEKFIIRTALVQILNIFKFHKPVRKTYRPKNEFFFFCLLIKFSFPF